MKQDETTKTGPSIMLKNNALIVEVGKKRSHLLQQADCKSGAAAVEC